MNYTCGCGSLFHPWLLTCRPPMRIPQLRHDCLPLPHFCQLGPYYTCKISGWEWCSKGSTKAVVPNLSGTRDQFCGRQFFSTDRVGDGFRMIQMHYICCVLCCSVSKSCPTLCDPMYCSIQGFPVLHHLPEFPQTHVH